MKNQGTKISVIQVIMTLGVCLTLISCAKGGSQRSAEESLVLGNSTFNPGEKAPGVELEPQSSNSILEQSQDANLASFSVLSPSGISEGGYIPGSGSGGGGSDSGSIPPPGGVSNPVSTPSTTIPSSNTATPSPSEPTIPSGTSSDVSPSPTTGDSSQGGSSSTVSDGTSSSTDLYPGGNDGGIIPGSGTASGTDNGSLPNSGTPSTGDGGNTPSSGTGAVADTGTGSSSGSSSTTDQNSGTTPGTDSSTTNSGGSDVNSGGSTGPVADNGTLPNSGTPSDSGTDNGSLPNSGTPSIGDGGNTPSSGTGTVADTGTGSTSPNPGTSGGETQVILCHYPPGNPANSITIIIGQPAVTAHLAHGDKLGDCPPSNGSSVNNGGNNNPNPTPPVTPDPDLDDHNDTCSCHHSVHPTPCQPNKKKLTINLGRVCSIRRSKTSDLFFEEAKNPILSIEAIVPKGRIAYGSQSSNPYATLFFSRQPNATQQWGVLSASNQAKERVLIATFNLKGIDLVGKKQKRSAAFNLKELKKQLGGDWTKAAIVASVCDDPNNDGSCYATPKSSLLSVVPATFKANRVPSQVGLDIWSGRGLSQSLDSTKCDKQYSPIVLDLTGEGIKLSGPEEGLKFDLNADGNEIYTGWIKGTNNAFLVRDINRNGKIDSGAELFGSATLLKNNKRAANGFEALKDLDSNADGLLSLKDLEWKSLRLWFDRNYDGFSQFSELNRLEQYQIQSINLNYVELLEMDEFGNQTRERSTYTRRIGGKDKPLLAVDVWFRTLIEQ